MKRALIAAVVAVVCVYGVMWLAVSSMRSRYEPREWPLKLGTLADVPRRYPDAETNAAAAKLLQMMPSVDVASIKAPLSDYDRVELERIGDRVQSPPANVAAFLTAHDAALDAVRDHILNDGPLVWELKFRLAHQAPIPNLLDHMQLSKLFVARALAKASRGDATGWDDLHATWMLSRTLWQRPELISRLIALAGTRMTNGAAAKMPLPVPAWFSEMQSFDYAREFAASYQAEAWMTMHTPPRPKIALPFVEVCMLDTAEGMREWTNALAGTDRCDVAPVPKMTMASWNPIGKVATPNLSGAWQRFARFRAEREATDKILALRRGETPPAQTKCADGSWLISANEVKFSRDIAVPPPGIRYPLVYQR